MWNVTQAQTYYWNGIDPVTSVQSWATERDGTGSSPTMFTTSGQVFVIQYGQSATATSLWNLAPSNTLRVESGGSFTTSAFHHNIGTLELDSTASYIHTNTTPLTFMLTLWNPPLREGSTLSA